MKNLSVPVFYREPLKLSFGRTCIFFVLSLLWHTATAQKPSISSFLPATGPVATPVTISGTNFSPVANANTVYVGGVKAVVTNATSTTLTVLVPAGSAYLPVSVTVNGLTAYSSAAFIITFPGGSSVLTTSSLASRLDVPARSNLSTAGTADLNGDGKMDIVVISDLNNLISVLRNTSTTGAISFSPRTDYTAGKYPVSVVFGDLDGDGKQDMLVVNTTANSISVFKNNSTADSISFLARVDLATDSMPLNCYVQGVDNDGKPDLLCTNSAANTISIFRNTSAAGNAITFAAKTSLATGKNPNGIVATDLDRDGMPEIAVANTEGAAVSIFKNRSMPGVVSFDAKIDYPNAYKPSVLMAGDMDGDGKTDLVAGSNESAVFSVLKNKSINGSLSFNPAVSFPTGFGASLTISLGDVNGDGKVDIASNHDVYSTVTLIKNQSSPDTLSFAARVDFITNYNTVSATLADLDGDGRPDLMAANTFGGSVSLFRNIVTKPFIASISPQTAGNGELVTLTGSNFTGTSAVRFGGVPASSFQVVSPTSLTAVVDTGSTGDVTVVTPYGAARISNFTFSRLPVIQSLTPQTGGAGTVITLNGINLTGTTSVTVGGIPATSFAVVSPTSITATVGTLPPGSYEVKVTTSAGTATLAGFYTGITVSGFYPASGPAGTTVTIQGTHFSNIPAANIVYFGAVRAPVTAATSTSLSVVAPAGTSYQPVTVTTDSLTAYSNKAFMETFKGTGNEFTPASFADVLDSAVGTFPIHVSISDLNNDGKPDVVVTNFSSYFISVSQNSGSAAGASFRRRLNFTTSHYPCSTSTGDLDGDGRRDIVVVNNQNGISFDQSITVFRNTTTGDSIQLSPTEYAIGYMTEDPTLSLITDFDNDGKPDVVILYPSMISVLKNTSRPGAISFAPGIDFYGIEIGTWMCSSDVDGDGKTDIIVSDINRKVVVCYRNISGKGSISFASPVRIETESNPLGLITGDVDHDGKEDMMVISLGNTIVSVYKNTSTPGNISFQPRTNFSISAKTDHVETGDLDGDGRLDIALTNEGNRTITVLKNMGGNSAISFGNPVEYTAPANLNRVFIADMNMDGKMDMVASNPNGTSFSVYVNKCADDGLPAAIINAGGPTELCEGSSVVLKTDRAGGAMYQWLKDGTAITGANDSVFTASAAGRYSVRVTINGTVAVSAPMNVSVKQAPAQPVIVSQAGNMLCQGSGTLLISSAKAGNQWYKDNVLLAGSIDSIYRVAGAGTYKVTASGNGCTATPSNAITITVTPALPPAMISSQVSSFCAGDSATLSANITAGIQYQWNVNEEPVPGASSPVLTTKIPGSYSVTTSGNGCNTSSATVTITRNPLPARPSVTQNGSVLQSSSPSGNQWYRDGVAITGATAQAYTPTGSGNYSVQVILNGCQSPVSESLSYVLTGIINIDNTHFIRLSPNPVSIQVKLDFNVSQVNALNVDLIDLNGRIIQRWTNLKNGATLDVSSFSKAIYLARIYNRNQKQVFILKILKQ